MSVSLVKHNIEKAKRIFWSL